MDTRDALTFKVLENAMKTAAAFRSRRRLQPAGGEGDKVFPPTFAGAVCHREAARTWPLGPGGLRAPR
jgi:CRISPR-associated protein Csb1